MEPGSVTAHEQSRERYRATCEHHLARYLSLCEFGTGTVVLALGYILTLQEPEAITLGTVDLLPFYRCYWPGFLLFFVATLCVTMSSTFKWLDAPTYLLIAFFTISVVVMVICLSVGFVVALMASHLSAFDLNNCITLSMSQEQLYMEYGPVCLCSRLVINRTLQTDDPTDLFAFRSDCEHVLRDITPLLKAASCVVLIAGVEVMLSIVLGRYGFSFAKRSSRSGQQDQQNF